jgi:hypothetical protein
MTSFPRLVAVNGQCLTTDPSASAPVSTAPEPPSADDWARLQAIARRLERLTLALERLAVAAVAEAEPRPARPVLRVIRGGRAS